MTFDEVLTEVIALLQREGRVAYQALKVRFDLDDDYLEGLKDELVEARQVAIDERGKVLVWTGGTVPTPALVRGSERAPLSSPSEPYPSVPLVSQPPAVRPQPLDSVCPEAERRQLTIMFCDIVGSTVLSERLDPEELREVMQAYQRTCVEVITRFDGHVAKYLGDGVLVYFGYPTAHEDDAARAVRAGLGIVEAMRESLQQDTRFAYSLQVRIGIHTGLVVAGEMGSGGYREQLAVVGETPNIAARLQEKATPNSVVISPATQRLVAGLFECQALGPQPLKGISSPLSVYRVVRESEAHSRFEVAVRAGLTPLVGRDEEVELLLKRWEQVKGGQGQVVLLRGEAGIGKSRLVQELKERVAREGYTRIEFRCSPYYQNTAFYPVIEHVQRVMQFRREDSSQEKLDKLERMLREYPMPLQDIVPLFAALLSLPYPDHYPSLNVSPQKRKQKTQEALVAWLVAEAERKAVLAAWEDLHWADPSTLELHSLLMDRVPTARILTLLTCRPEFSPPWGTRSQLIQLTLSRLGRKQVAAMVEKVAGGKALSAEVVQQIVTKTDGVPLFVEELTKMVVESGGAYGCAPLQTIPATLYDLLMARLDRLATSKEVAQLGATLGREFNYELLRAVSSLDETALQRELNRLVDTELLYQRGVPPRARYVFKHALIQDAAYQSLLKSTRQYYHRQIAQVLEQRFPEIKETNPELLAHHYTEASRLTQAIPHWLQAGQRAIQRSANREATAHLTKGLELLQTLPETPERAQHELPLRLTLGAALMAIKGYAAPEVEKTYARARELCRQMGETPQLFPVLLGLWRFYQVRGELQTVRELGEQLFTLAQSVQKSSAFFVEAHYALGVTLYYLGELASAHEQLEQGSVRYDLRQHRSHAFLYGTDPGVVCLSYDALALWLLGYPDQALKKSHEALALARELAHPFSLAFALVHAAPLQTLRHEGRLAQEQAEAAVTLSVEQGFTLWFASGTIYRGWALAEQGQTEEGVAQICQGIATYQATGAELVRTWWLTLLAGVYGKAGRAEEGLSVVAEALAAVNKTGERVHEAELYRLQGILTLQRFQALDFKCQVPTPQSPTPHGQLLPLNPQAEVEAEVCFQKAIAIASRQQAKSFELRAVMSLARLWQQQGRKDEARQMLAEIYGRFVEGFETADLKEAKILLETLSGG